MNRRLALERSKRREMGTRFSDDEEGTCALQENKGNMPLIKEKQDRKSTVVHKRESDDDNIGTKAAGPGRHQVRMSPK